MNQSEIENILNDVRNWTAEEQEEVCVYLKKQKNQRIFLQTRRETANRVVSAINDFRRKNSFGTPFDIRIVNNKTGHIDIIPIKSIEYFYDIDCLNLYVE